MYVFFRLKIYSYLAFDEILSICADNLNGAVSKTFKPEINIPGAKNDNSVASGITRVNEKTEYDPFG